MKSALVFAPRLCSLHPLSTLSSINRNIYPAKPSSFVSLSISLAFSFSPRLTSTRVSTVNLFLNYKDFQLAGSELMTFFIHASQGTQLEVDRLLNLNIFSPLHPWIWKWQKGISTFLSFSTYHPILELIFICLPVNQRSPWGRKRRKLTLIMKDTEPGTVWEPCVDRGCVLLNWVY